MKPAELPDGSFHLGRIGFIREADGSLAIGQSWNPRLIPRDDRAHIAETLHEIADMMEDDKFEINQTYKFFKAPKSR